IKTVLDAFVRREFEKRKRGNAPVLWSAEINRGAEIPLGEFPSDIIQGRTGIGDAVPDDCAQPERWSAGDYAGQRVNTIGDPRIRLLCGLAPNFVRLLVEVHPDFGLQGVEVLLCPDDFEASAV